MLRRSLAALLCWLLAIAPAAAFAEKPSPKERRYLAYMEASGKFGNTKLIGEGALFLPLWQTDQTLVFFDLRGRGNSVDTSEVNLGVAVRRMFSERWIAGTYIFLDYVPTSPAGNSFVGGMMGFEFLSNTWDFRFNGYFPEGNLKPAPQFDSVEMIPGFGVRLAQEKALGGFDLEAGWRLPFHDDSLFWDTRLFLGGYSFTGEGFDSVSGPRGRLELRLHKIPLLPTGSRFTVNAEVQWDDPRGTQVFGGIRLRLPFWMFGGRPPDGATPASKLARRMTDRVERDVDIVTNISAGPLEPAYNPVTGAAYSGLRYAEEAGDGDGSFDDPAALDAALADVGADGVVVALASAGDIDTGVAPANLQVGQTLLGGGSDFTVLTAAGTPLQTIVPGQRPTLDGGASASPVVTAGDQTLIQGLDVRGGAQGVRIQNVQRAHLADLDIQGSAGDGVFIDTATTVSIADTTVHDLTGTLGDGIAVQGSDGVDVHNTTIENVSGAGAHGIWASGSQNVSVRDTTVSNILGGDGIRFGAGSSGIAVDNVEVSSIEAVGRAGLVLDAVSNATITGARVSDIRAPSGAAIRVDASSDVTISGADVQALAGDSIAGIDVRNGSATVRIEDSQISGGAGVGVSGISITGSSETTLANVAVDTISGTSSNGVRVSGSDLITLEGITVSGVSSNSGAGIEAVASTQLTLQNLDVSDISDVNADGVRIVASSDVTISDSTVRSISSGNGAAIAVLGGAFDVDLTDVQIDGLDSAGSGPTHGVDIGASSDVSLTRVDVANVSGADSAGILVNASDAVSITGGGVTTIGNVGSDGVRIRNGSDDVSLTDVTVSASTSQFGSGVEVDQSTNVTLTRVAIDDFSGESGAGIHVSGSTDVLVTDSTNSISNITGIGGTGIRIDGDSLGVDVTNLTISQLTADSVTGIEIGAAMDVEIRDVVIGVVDGAGAAGISTTIGADTVNLLRVTVDGVEGASSRGLDIDDAIRLTVQDSTISNFGGTTAAGIDVYSSSEITLNNVAVSNMTGDDSTGVLIDNGYSAITALNVSVRNLTGARSAGISTVESTVGVQSATIDNINAASRGGIIMDNAVDSSVQGSTVSNISGDGTNGIAIQNESDLITLTDNQISGIHGLNANGLAIRNSQNVVISGGGVSQLSGVDGNGIEIVDGSSSINLSSVAIGTIGGQGGDAIDIENSSEVSIFNADIDAISGDGGNGVLIAGSSLVTINATSINRVSGASGDGVEIASGNDNVSLTNVTIGDPLGTSGVSGLAGAGVRTSGTDTPSTGVTLTTVGVVNVSGANGAGFHLSNANVDLRGGNVQSVTGTGGDGLVIAGVAGAAPGDTTVSVNETTINGAQDVGIDISGPATVSGGVAAPTEPNNLVTNAGTECRAIGDVTGQISYLDAPAPAGVVQSCPAPP